MHNRATLDYETPPAPHFICEQNGYIIPAQHVWRRVRTKEGAVYEYDPSVYGNWRRIEPWWKRFWKWVTK